MVELLLDRGYPAGFLDGLIPQQLEELYDLTNRKNLHHLPGIVSALCGKLSVR